MLSVKEPRSPVVTGVDTNIIVRLLTRDNERQCWLAENIFANEQIFIADTVILETEWVLRFSYGFKPDEIRRALKKLFGLPNVYISNPEQLKTVLRLYKAGLDFADAMHLGANLNQQTFVTFDKKFIQRAKGKTQCTVKEP